VDQLRYRSQAALVLAVHRDEPTFEVVLDGFHVVGRAPFELGEFGDVAAAEVVDETQQVGLLVGGERADMGDDLAGSEVDQPLDLDPDPLAVQRGLREVVHQRGDGSAVAAVESAKGDGRGRISKRDHAGHPPRVCAVP
jgi:hypothetical protein